MKNHSFLIVMVSFTLALWGQTCTDCHDGVADKVNKTFHQGISCETCHPGGDAHKEDPSTENAPGVSSAVCQTCHGAFTPSIKHRQKGMDCFSCHSFVHGKEKGEPTPYLLKAKGDKVCQKCHREQAFQRKLPHKHRVPCYECHNPHKEKPKTTSLCVTCHVEKEGPFVYEHLPKRVGKCTLCHEPHGSPNPRLLIRNRVDMLCLECHMGLSSYHDLSQTLYQNCVVCHGEIHGSNRDPSFQY